MHFICQCLYIHEKVEDFGSENNTKKSLVYCDNCECFYHIFVQFFPISSICIDALESTPLTKLFQYVKLLDSLPVNCIANYFIRCGYNARCYGHFLIPLRFVERIRMENHEEIGELYQGFCKRCNVVYWIVKCNDLPKENGNPKERINAYQEILIKSIKRRCKISQKQA